MGGKKLKEGFTTGTASAAAAKAAILALKGVCVKEIDTPLPSGSRFVVPVFKVQKVSDFCCRVSVIKDGGDDPDVTSGAEIVVTVTICPDTENRVLIKGGRGVGRVTKPGLPVPVGEWAINPYPREQIKIAVKEGMMLTGLKGKVEVTIEVVNGEEIAKKTLNPKLGIIGGISILGTRGTVKPFSHEAYIDTIKVCLNIARATGSYSVAMSTGGRSERFLRRFVNLPEDCFVQIGDFFGDSLKLVRNMGFKEIYLGSFFGKLLKLFQKNSYTHAKASRIDFKALSRWCCDMGMEREKLSELADSNTAFYSLKVILSSQKSNIILERILKEAISFLKKFGGRNLNMYYYLFNQDGTLLKRIKG